MAGKIRFNVDFPAEVLDRLTVIAKTDNIAISALIVKCVREYVDEMVGGAKTELKDPVAYMLRPCDQPNTNWSRGGKWFLDWICRSEPDWRRQHILMLPRHYPIPLDGRETRCVKNGGGDHSLSINDHISEMRGHQLPFDFPSLGKSQWESICNVYRGCCGERIRFLGAPHSGPTCPA